MSGRLTLILTSFAQLFSERIRHYIPQLFICIFCRNFCPKIFLSTDLVERNGTEAVLTVC